MNERQSCEPVVLYSILLVNITPFKNIDQNLFITLRQILLYAWLREYRMYNEGQHYGSFPSFS